MFNNTFAVLDKIKKDLLKAVIIGDITLQVMFLILYGYSIYSNINHLFFLISNSCLLGISLFYLIFSIYSISSKGIKLSKKMKKNVKRAVNYTKYVIRFLALGLSVYEIFSLGASDITKIITVVTALGLVFQIITEVMQVIVTKYVEMLKESAVMDYEASMAKTAVDYYQKLMDAKNDKLGYVLEAVDFIPGKIADKLNGVVKEKEVSIPLDKDKAKLRGKIDNLASSYKAEADALKEEKNALREEEIVAKRDDHRKKKLNDLKNHFNIIKAKVIKK